MKKNNIQKSIQIGKILTFPFAILILFLLLVPATKTEAETYRFVSEQTMEVTARPLDPRAQILKDYLDKYNSPLANHAQDFIEAADTYNVDWKLVPAISGVESTFGKAIPGGYNAWGWGVYGDQALGFKSWKDGIYTLNKGLRENYINKGFTEPYSMNRIYASSETWGSRVSYFMADLDTFAKNYKTQDTSSFKNKLQKTKIAGSSASLTLIAIN